MVSEALARQSNFKLIKADLDRSVSRMALLMPAALRTDEARAQRMALRVARVALGNIAANAKLQECTLDSLRSSVIRTCQLGLELDPTLMHAAMVPFYNNRNKTTECQLIIGYRGYIQLMTRSGAVFAADAEVVYKADEFSFAYGTQPFLKHVPDLEKESEARCAYGVAELAGGVRKFRIIKLAYIDRICEAAKKKTRGNTPWATDWEEMARKTAIRNLAKYLPQAVEAQQEAVRDEARDAGVPPRDVGWDEAIETSTEARVIDVGEPDDFGPEPPERDPGSEG